MLVKNLFIALFISLATPLAISIEPYFSKTSGGYYKGGVDNIIIKDINGASSSIKMAMYYLTNKNITKALVEAHHRGVVVEIITDDKKISSKRYRYLLRVGIKVENDEDRRALMHNKILIIDNNSVWIGSGNYTVYAFYRNHDNYLHLQSRAIARYYTQKFNSLYSHNNTPIEPYISERLEIYFAPDSNIEEQIIRNIDGAKSTINIMMFAFTNPKIAKALTDAISRGVVVKIVLDKTQNRYQKYSIYRDLKSKGVDIKLDKNRYKLHHKVIIIDNKIVITGSYNYTKKANTINSENIIIIKDYKIAKEYSTEFKRVY